MKEQVDPVHDATPRDNPLSPKSYSMTWSFLPHPASNGILLNALSKRDIHDHDHTARTRSGGSRGPEGTA